MRTLCFLSLIALGAVQTLGVFGARVGGSVIPSLGWPLFLVIALGILTFRGLGASTPRVWSWARFACVSGLLTASGWGVFSVWNESLRPAEPLRASTIDMSEAATLPRRVSVAGVESLHMNDRRLLARVAGRRRNFALDIEGFLMVPRAGSYRLELDCDDWCSLSLDGQVLLNGEGSLTESLALTPGAKRFELGYRQLSGPAFLVFTWVTPATVELLPVESYLAGSPEAFERVRFRYLQVSRFGLVAIGLLWLASSVHVLLRGAEAAGTWVGAARDWLRQPPGEKTSLVRPRCWAASGVVLFALGAIAKWRLPARLEALARDYEVSPRRAPFVLERAEAFPDYLFFLAALCLGVAVVFLWLPASAASAAAADPMGARRARAWILAGLAATSVWGVVVSQSEWVRYGRPCYDGYCDYAERVRDWMVSPGDDSWERLRGHLSRNYHANSPVGPVAIAGLSLALGRLDTVPSYRLLSALSTLGTLLLLLTLARRELGLREMPTLVAAFLFTASGSIQRSSLFPQTDAVAMFFFALTVERTLALRRSFDAGRFLMASLALALALLTKLSALPLVAVVFVLAAWPGSQGSERPHGVLAALARAALVVVPPAVLVAVLVVAFRTTENVRTELVRIETLDSTPGLHLVATLVTLLPLVIALLLTLRWRFSRIELMLTSAVAIYLVGLWSSGASGWERFYLNAVPMALPLAVARFGRLRELNSAPRVAVLLAAYVSAHTVRMLFHLYNGA